MELTEEFYIQTRLFLRFPQGSCLEAFATIDKTAGERPAEGRIFPSYQKNAAIQLYDDVDGRKGVFPGHGEGSATGLFKPQVNVFLRHDRRNGMFID